MGARGRNGSGDLSISIHGLPQRNTLFTLWNWVVMVVVVEARGDSHCGEPHS